MQQACCGTVEFNISLRRLQIITLILTFHSLRIPVVDVVGAVRFAFSADSAALPLPRWMDRSALATIRTEICHLLDARLAAENAKQKKDKNTLYAHAFTVELLISL